MVLIYRILSLSIPQEVYPVTLEVSDIHLISRFLENVLVTKLEAFHPKLFIIIAEIPLISRRLERLGILDFHIGVDDLSTVDTLYISGPDGRTT